MAIRILGIETSCDETAAAVVEDGRTLLSNVIASQIDVHAQYGGVFPEVASRIHIEAIHEVVKQALLKAHVTLDDIHAIAVTRGPGLAGSLLVGMNAAKGIALGAGLPLIGVNHLEGHIYAQWLTEHVDELRFPLIVLLVSGGHTELIVMKEHRDYHRLGGTIDDAVGEAFDKVGRLLGLPYPGGPHIEQAAKQGNAEAFNFPRSWLEGTWDFSFSGLKTSVLREIKKRYPDYNAGREPAPRGLPVPDLAASFQAAAIEVLIEKAVQAAEQNDAGQILVAGGVSANKALKQGLIDRAADSATVYSPPLALCTDNAAMIAAAAFQHYEPGIVSQLASDITPTWPLGPLATA